MHMDKTKIQRILFITLSNIGDIVLTTPAMRVISEDFPEAELDVMAGPNGAEIFNGHPAVSKMIIYDKHASFSEKRRLVKGLRQAGYDLVVDMRNTLFPFIVGARYKTNPFLAPPRSIRHKKKEHLWKLSTIGLGVEDAPFYVHISHDDRKFIDKALAKTDRQRPVIAVSPGAKSSIKRWPGEKFSLLLGRLIKELGAQIIIVGDSADTPLARDISVDKEGVMDLSGRTTLGQLASLLERSDLLITNDSAPLHLAGAVDTKVLAIFGPTDPAAYGPTGRHDRIARKKLHCSPCGKAQCRFHHECMRSLDVDEVFDTAKEMLAR